MVYSRRLPIPTATGRPVALPTRYAAAPRPSEAPPPRRGPDVLTAVLSLVLGLVGGFCVHVLAFPPPSPLAHLTPQQQEIYHLVYDLSQASTAHQAWQVQGRIDKVVRNLHPQPRPQPEALLPGAAK